jgi:hypothetical protein
LYSLDLKHFCRSAVQYTASTLTQTSIMSVRQIQRTVLRDKHVLFTFPIPYSFPIYYIITIIPFKHTALRWLPSFRVSGPGRRRIATRNGLEMPGFESWQEARFPAPVQTDPGAHPASYTKGTRSLTGLKWPGRDNNPPPSSAKVKSEEQMYTSTAKLSSWQFIGRIVPLLLLSGFGLRILFLRCFMILSTAELMQLDVDERIRNTHS